MTPLTAVERRSVIALLTSVFCGGAASAAGITALGKAVFDLTGNELDLGLLGLAEFLPALLLVLVTGPVADRFDRRVVACLGLGLEVVAGMLLAAHIAAGPTSIGRILGIVVLLGIGRAFVAPASRSLPSDIVAAERLPWLIPRYSASWQASVIVGPVLAGFLYAVDEALPFVAMAVLLGIGMVAVLVIRVAPVSAPVADIPAPAGLHEAFEGLRFIRRQPILFGAIGLDLFAVLFGGAVALLPAIATERLGVGAIGLGWLRAAGGIGAAAVTLGLARRPVTRRVGRVLLVSVVVFGAATVLLGVTTSYVVAFVAFAVLSGADAISVFIRATLVPLVTPYRMRGRVLAVENVFIGGSNELGAFESGVAGQLVGAGPAVAIGGLLTIGIAGAWWFLFADLRDVDGFPTTALEGGAIGLR